MATKKKMASAVMGSSQRQRQRQRELGRVSIYLLFMMRLNSPAGLSTVSSGSLWNDCGFRKQLWLSISFSTVFGKEMGQPSFITRQCCNHMPVWSSRTRWPQCVTTLGSVRWRLDAAAGDSSALDMWATGRNDAPALESLAPRVLATWNSRCLL